MAIFIKAPRLLSPEARGSLVREKSSSACARPGGLKSGNVALWRIIMRRAISTRRRAGDGASSRNQRK